MTAEQILDQLKTDVADAANKSTGRFHSLCNISNKSAILVRISDQLALMEGSISEGADAFNDAVYSLAKLCVEYLAAASNSVN